MKRTLADRRRRSTSDRVAAQEARRAMDRVVGFPLSNLLGKKVAGGLSAGRVQSVAVKLIVDREREIEAFKTEEYWKITALLANAGLAASPWTADPAKSKIFAKKKAARPTSRTSRRGSAGRRHRTSRSWIPRHRNRKRWRRTGRGQLRSTPSREGRHSRAAGRRVPRGTRRSGTTPSPKLDNEAADGCHRRGASRTCRSSSPRSSRRTGKTGRTRRSPRARCSSRRTSGCGSAPAARCRRAQKLYEGVELHRHGPDGAHHLHANRQHAGFERRPHRRARPSSRRDSRLGPKYLPATAERLRVRQGGTGSPRGDPPDRRDHHAAAGPGRWALPATSTGSTS